MNFEKMRTKRKFSADERLSIIREAEREGRLETIRKYTLHHRCLIIGDTSI